MAIKLYNFNPSYNRDTEKETNKNYKRERYIMEQAIIQLETLSCPSCIQKIDNAVKGIDGVDKESVKVMFNASRLKANFDKESTSIENIENAIEKLGYEVLKSRVKSA